MPLSRPGRDGTLPDPDRAVATVHAALDLGVTLIDTADCYGPDGTRATAAWAQRGARRAGAARARPRRCWSPPRAASGATAPTGRSTAGRRGSTRRSRLAAPPRGRRRSTSTSTTGPTRRCRTPRRWAPSRSCTTPGWCAASGSPTPTSTRSREAHEILGEALVERAEPVLPGVPQQRGRARALRRARPGVPAVEPAGRHERGGRARRRARGRSRRSPSAHGVSPQQVCLAWLLATRRARDPDPRRQPARLGHRLLRRHRPDPDRRGAGPPRWGGWRR